MTDPHAPESRPGGILASCTSSEFPAPRRAPEFYVAQTTGVLGRCIRIPLTQYIPPDAPKPGKRTEQCPLTAPAPPASK